MAGVSRDRPIEAAFSLPEAWVLHRALGEFARRLARSGEPSDAATGASGATRVQAVRFAGDVREAVERGRTAFTHREAATARTALKAYLRHAPPRDQKPGSDALGRLGGERCSFGPRARVSHVGD